MKRKVTGLLIILICGTLLYFEEEVEDLIFGEYYIEQSYLVTRSDTTYEINSQTPFRGIEYMLHPNGQTYYEHRYREGKRVGEHILYYPNGEISEIGNYKNGKLDGLVTGYGYPSGNISYTKNYKKGKLHGLQEEYSSKGKLYRTINYKNGLRHGLKTNYHVDTGKLDYAENYKNGKLDGFKFYYDSNEDIRAKECFKNGVKQVREIWKNNGHMNYLDKKVDNLDYCEK
jgi:antitoxin component YwqK of YwqJK toxin-antitoxin module